MLKVIENFSLNDKGEAFVIGLFDEHKQNDLFQQLDEIFEGELGELLRDGEIKGKEKAISKIHTLGKIGFKKIYFVGLGKQDQYKFSRLREAFGRLVKQVKKDRLTELTIALDTFVCGDITTIDATHALGEAVSLAGYSFSGFKKKPNIPDKDIETVIVYTTEEKREIQAAFTRWLYLWERDKYSPPFSKYAAEFDESIGFS